MDHNLILHTRWLFFLGKQPLQIDSFPNVACIGFLRKIDSIPILYLSHVSILSHSLLQIKKGVRTKSSIQFYTQYSPYVSSFHSLPHIIKKVCSESGSEGITHIPKSLQKERKIDNPTSYEIYVSYSSRFPFGTITRFVVIVDSSNVSFRRHFLTIVEIFIAHLFWKRERERRASMLYHILS